MDDGIHNSFPEVDRVRHTSACNNITHSATRCKTGFKLSVLVSTIAAGLQELIKAYKARWGLEVMHRTLRQNLALAACQCLALLAQLRHIDWCIAALHCVRRQRQHDPALSWKQAQKLAAEESKHALLTEHVAVAA